MTQPRALRLRDLHVEYPQFALGPVSVSVAAGERVALVGENGAGKSTMLRTISGLQTDYTGSVEVEGVEVRTRGPKVRTRVGLLPERMLAFGWMTVAEHLDFLSAAHPGWDADYAKTLRERLIVPEDTKVANLSKGMSVKLSFLTAEAFRPPILLLDEPTSGVDPVMRREIIGLIHEAVPADSPRAVVFSTHILEDVEAVAERVLLLRRGRLIADTSIEALRSERPGGSVSDAIYARLTDHE